MCQLIGSLVAIAEEHVEQPAEAGNKGGDIGVSGRVECLVDANHFVLIDDAEADELRLRTFAGVEFDGQCDELEDGQDQIDCDAEVDQHRAVEQHKATEHNKG